MQRIDIPRAPGLGLVLEQVHFDRYGSSLIIRLYVGSSHSHNFAKFVVIFVRLVDLVFGYN